MELYLNGSNVIKSTEQQQDNNFHWSGLFLLPLSIHLYLFGQLLVGVIVCLCVYCKIHLSYCSTNDHNSHHHDVVVDGYGDVGIDKLTFCACLTITSFKCIV